MIQPLFSHKIVSLFRGVMAILIASAGLASAQVSVSVNSTTDGNGLFTYTFNLGSDPYVWGLSSDNGNIYLPSFWAAEAALSLAALPYNLTVLFQRHLGWQTKVTIHSLRFWLFVTAGIISHPQGKTTIKLAVPPRERDWWHALWEKILSPFRNCTAVENRAAFRT